MHRGGLFFVNLIALSMLISMVRVEVCTAQNVFQNADFESYNRLPQNEGQLNLARHWITLVQSADYLNYTYSGWSDHVGLAKSGKGYAGFASYGNSNGASEAIAQEISTKIASVPYLLHFYIKASNKGSFSESCAGIDLYAFEAEPMLDQFNMHISDMPTSKRLWSSAIITDTTWAVQQACITLSGKFKYLGFTLAKKPGCMQYIYIDDIQLIPMEVDIGKDLTLCEGDSIILRSPWPSGTFRWEDNSTDSVRTITKSGTYSLIVEAGGCKAVGKVTYTFTPPPYLNLGADTAICHGDTMHLSVPAEFDSFSWSSGQLNRKISVYRNKSVSLTVYEDICWSSDFIEIKILPKPTVNLGPDTTFCPNFSYLLKAEQPRATFLWSNGETQDHVWAVKSDLYWVESRLGPCRDSDTVQIDEIAWPGLELGSDLKWCPGDLFLIGPTVVDDLATYEWSDGSVELPRKIQTSGVYTLTSIHPCGVQTDSIQVVTGSCACHVQIPNAFSPQSDQINESFGTVNLCEFEWYELRIYNRWGQLVFVSKEPEVSWNGRYQNHWSPSGVYMYMLQYKGFELPPVRKSGTLTLLK